MGDSELSGGEWVVKALDSFEISTVFGIPGGHILEIYDALADSSIRQVMARHENSVVRMAAGFSRTGDHVGVGIATSGPGATNAMTALAEAYTSSVPLLFITTYQSSPDGVHALPREGNQETALEAVAKSVTVVRRPEEIIQAIGEGFEKAESGRPGPCVIMLDQACVTDTPKNPPLETCTRESQPPLQAGPLVEAVDSSSSPVILCGQGALIHSVDSEIFSLADCLAAPIVTTERGLGAIAGDAENYAGVYSYHVRQPQASSVIHGADLLIEVGVRRNNQRILEDLECDRVHISDVYPPNDVTGCVMDDLKTGLMRLIEELPKDRSDDCESFDTRDTLLMQLRKKLSKVDGLTTGHILQELEKIQHPRMRLVSDVGDHTNWIYHYWTPTESQSYVNPDNYMAMGFALPTAIGLQIANPDQSVVAIIGDGSIQMNLAEFTVAVAEKLPLTVIIPNNSAHGVIERGQINRYNRKYSTRFPSLDFASYAENCGGMGIRVENKGQLAESLKTAVSSTQPTIIDVDTLPNLDPGYPS